MEIGEHNTPFLDVGRLGYRLRIINPMRTQPKPYFYGVEICYPFEQLTILFLLHSVTL